MNCKPDQLAWIKVPRDMAQGGVEQLQNRVVQTKTVVPHVTEPTWTVEPAQSILLSMPIKDAAGLQAGPGQRYEVFGIPDSWLVPLRGDPVPTIDDSILILEMTR